MQGGSQLERRGAMRYSWLWIAVVLFGFTAESRGQIFGGRLRQPQPALENEAITGHPFGVGRWQLELPAGVNPNLLGNSGFTLTEKNNRVFYQAFDAAPVRAVVREIIGRPQIVTVYFLFQGSEPLDLTLYAPTAISARLVPRADAVQHARLAGDWWVKYTRGTNRIDRPADYPDVVDNYLLAMLAQRMNLPPASQVPPHPARMLIDTVLSTMNGEGPKLPGMDIEDDELDHEVGLLTGADSFRSAMQTQVLAKRTAEQLAERANSEMPAGLSYISNVPEVLGDVPIEPLAMHVPAECFYIRFGGFANYKWFGDTLKLWGGDLQNMVLRRGLNFGLNERMERQLSLKESALAPLLGPAIIADVAMIGTDVFFREGAAIGMLFEARNNFALSSDFARQRAATLQAFPDAKDEQVEIAGRKVSFLHTPDNRVRSYYAADGEFHLVTNSRYTVERFFAAGAGKNALGASNEFKFARSLLPVARGDTVFAYLSSEFFNNIAGPHYQIEMARRMRAAAEIDVALVAQLAARGEGNAAKSLDQLIAAEYLPAGFGQRSDGSRLIPTADGSFTDSLRGGRGTFTPIPDVTFDRVTAAEAERYESFKTWFQSKWTQLDPVVAAVNRRPGPTADVEQVVIDAQLTPLAAKNYDTLAAKLGSPGKQRLAPVQGDIAAAEAVLQGNIGTPNGTAVGEYRLFAGLRNAGPPVVAAMNPDAGAARPAGPLGGLLGPGGALEGVQINGRPLTGAINTAMDGQVAGGGAGGLGGGLGNLLSSAGSLLSLPPFYVGANPTPELFQRLGLNSVAVDAAGYGRSLLGLWQRRIGSMTLLSMQRETIDAIFPQLKYVNAKRPAQLWLFVGDVGQSKLAGTINGLFYQSAKSASMGNLRFLHSLNAQLHVIPKDAVQVAQLLVDATLVDPLGGKYELRQPAGALPTWYSTFLSAERMRLIDGLTEPPPADFKAPLLDWLKELQADVVLEKPTLSLHVDVLMKRTPGTAPATAPATSPSAATNNGPGAPPPIPQPPVIEELPPPRPQ